MAPVTDTSSGMSHNEESTINEKNMEHFVNLVDVWWKGNGLKSLRKMNQVRVPFIQNSLARIGKADGHSAKPLAGLNILDVGCGGGYLSEALAGLGAQVTGLDVALELVKCAELHAKENDNLTNNLHYVCDTIENFCKTNVAKYDVIVSSEVVEHVENVDKFLKCCIKTLKPNGSLIITTINKTTRSWLVAIILKEYILGIIPKGTHEWKKFITPENLQEILTKYDCEQENLSGAYYNYFTEEWKDTCDTSVTYLLHAIKRI